MPPIPHGYDGSSPLGEAPASLPEAEAADATARRKSSVKAKAPPPSNANANTNTNTTEEEEDLPPIEGRRAWLVVLGAFLVHVTVLGMLYGVGVFLQPIAAEFGTNRGSVGVVGVINLGCFQGLGIFTGPLADRYGTRVVMSTGIAVWVVGLVVASFAQEFWQVIIGMGVLTGAGTAGAYWPAISVVPQWFGPRRGLATSLAVLGAGVGNLMFALGGQAIISSPALGWRNTLRIFAGVDGFLLVVACFLIQRRLPRVTHGGLFGTAFELIKLRNYQLFVLATFFFQFAFFLPWTWITFYATDRGLDTATASLALAMLGIGSSVGRLVWGPLADMWGRLKCFRLTMFIAFACMVAWPSCRDAPSILSFAFFYSFAAGGFIAMSPLVSSDLWGAHRLGGTFALLNLVMLPGSLSASPLAGVAYDNTKSFEPAIYAASGALFITASIMMFVRPTPVVLPPSAAPPSEGTSSSQPSNGASPPPGSTPVPAAPLTNDVEMGKTLVPSVSLDFAVGVSANNPGFAVSPSAR